jgi:hypothetical protein
MSDRSYYVIFENDDWKVKLERGRVVSANHRTQQGAINEARQLGRRNNRTVVVNAKEGYTRRHIKNP